LNKDDLIEKQFGNEISRLIGKIPQSKYKESQELMNDFLEKNQTVSYDNIFRIQCDSREMSLVKAALFLLDYEGKFGFCVNLTCFLYLANDSKMSKSFDNIEQRWGMKDKCEFLAKVGFQTFGDSKEKYVENPDLEALRNFRNTIAHFNFIIDEDGMFSIYNRDPNKRIQKGILLEHNELLDYINGMISVLRDYIKVPY
jgi:hypothetical protein